MAAGLAFLFLVAMVGGLVGAAGIGGFLLVPVLVLMEGASVREAVVVATLSFLVAGSVSLWAMHREAAEGRRGVGAFLLLAVPGAVLGALIVDTTEERLLGGLIACAFAVAGVLEWLGLPRTGAQERLGTAAGSIGGCATGLASALTGTSGPMAAIPILGLLGVDVRKRLRIAQVAQIPIGIAALLTYAMVADIPWKLAGQTAAALALGTFAGIHAGRRVPATGLRRATALLMLAASAYMAATVF